MPNFVQRQDAEAIQARENIPASKTSNGPSFIASRRSDLFQRRRRKIADSVSWLALATALSLGFGVPSSAFAQSADGNGGNGGKVGGFTSGADGGTGFSGAAGSPGTSLLDSSGTGGGGGAAGGGTGGNGGDSNVSGGAGGAGGAAGSPDGGVGGPGSNSGGSGSGGGGGGGGFNGNGSGTAAIANTGLIKGGNGGAGGEGAGAAATTSLDDGGGGGGGGGGYGAIVTGTGDSTNSSTGTIQGGDGGKGGDGGNSPPGADGGVGSDGGAGGNGGTGILFSASGAGLTNAGTISGGNGGSGGAAGSGVETPGGNGGDGTGGFGVEGAGLTIVNTGTISGGMDGTNTFRNAAIVFTDTSALASTLNITSTSTINGNVVDTGGSYNFVLGGTANGSFNTALLGTQYQDVGNFQIDTGNATTVWTLTGTNAYTGPVEVTQGILNVTTGTLNSSSALTLDGGTLQAGGTLTVSNTTTLGTGTTSTLDSNGNALTYSGEINGSGNLIVTSSGGGGDVMVSAANSYGGTTTIEGGSTLTGGAANTFSAMSATTIETNGTLDLGDFAQAIDSVSLNGGTIQNGTLTGAISSTGGTVNGIGGSATLTTTAGTTDVLGVNAYTGATTVNGGTLNVTGSIEDTSSVTVNSGGTLTGDGTVDPPAITIMSGGTFTPGTAGTPGTSMDVEGGLDLESGSTYKIYLNPTTSTFANVTGAATVGGAVEANFANGSYLAKTYTILTTTDGVTGTFSGLTNVNLPANVSDSLSYEGGDDVFLNLSLAFTAPAGPLTNNQRNVADTFVNFFNSTGGIPMQFGTLSAPALTQVDGEGNTGAEHTAFQLETEFLTAMLDPFVDGRFGQDGSGEDSSGQPLGYTSEQQFMPQALALAYGRVLKGPPPVVYVPHWSAWGTAYGGASITGGNASAGSSQLNASTFGFAGGMDYHVSADTIVGLSLGGGGTNWDLAGVSGSGRSEALQAGVYGVTRSGPLYGGAAFGFGNNWFTTDRTALGDQLRANFGGQSYGGRLEGGYRLSGLPFDVTPYSAVQAQAFETPAYSETDLTGGGFGLSYASMSATDVRTELGSRFAVSTSLADLPVVLRGKLAWAHDFVDNPSLSAGFESLPGTTFVVNGAPIPHNSALVSGGAELFLAPHLSVLAKFDGEFAGNSQTYGGTGTLRYTW